METEAYTPGRSRVPRLTAIAVAAFALVAVIVLWPGDEGAGANNDPSVSDSGIYTQWQLASDREPFEQAWDSYRHSLWFSEGNPARGTPDFLATLNPATGLLREWGPPTAGGYVHAVTTDHANDIWFSEVEQGKIARLNPESNSITEWTLYTGAEPHDIAVDDTNPVSTTVWISEREVDVISSLDPATGIYMRHLHPLPVAWPHSVYLAPDHSIWFVETCGNRVGQLVPGTTDTWRFWQPNTPAVQCGPPAGIGPLFGFFHGSDFWYSEPYNGNIIRLRPDTNTFSIWPVPGAANGAKLITQVAADPDGNIFYPAMAGNIVGRLEPSGPTQPTVVVVAPTVVSQAAPPEATAPVATVVFTPIVTQLTPATQVLTGTRNGGFTEWALPSVSPTALGRWVGPARLTYAEGGVWLSEDSARRISKFAVFTPTATPCAISFTDVPPENAFYPYVRCLACRGILGGYNDGTFRPNNNITRGQIAKIVSNAAAFSDLIPQNQQTYTDVPNTNTFWLWIERLTVHQVMSGYNCGGPGEPCDPQNRPYFRWANNATRAQLAKIDSNAAGYSETPTGQAFTDVPTDHPFYLWIERLAERAIMGGYPCGGVGEPCDPQNRPYFRPYNNVTRGQAAKIVSNTFYPNCQTPR